MDEKEQKSAFLSALVTEHSVLQTAANGAVSEATGRASLFLGANASMVAFINSIVAGAGVTLLAGNLLPGGQMGPASRTQNLPPVTND